jgi:Putative prokaryotic signal transducing protein
MSDSRVVEVYRAKNATQAHMLATALEEAGIKAEVQGENLHPLSLTAVNLISDSPLWWAAPRILVLEEDAERAGQLLLEWEARERMKAQETEGMPPVDAVCEKCGRLTSFPAAQRGSVQECPQCGGYIDVGDEESPDDGDWGEAEAEDAED